MKTVSEAVFRRGLRKAGCPERVLIEVTHRCNFRCSHCYITGGNPGHEAAADEFDALLRSIAASGAITIGFTGGEPLMRDDIFSILKTAGDAGFRPLLYTNASLVTPSKARKLKTIGVAKVVVSMHGATARSFERITGIEGSFTKTKAGIAALRAAGVPIGIKSCAPSLNPGDVKQLAAMAEEWGAHLRLSPVLLGKDSNGKDCAGFAEKPLPGKKGTPSLFPPCGSASSQCTVTPSLRLKPCPALPFPCIAYNGNFRQSLSRLSDEWEKLKGKLRNKCSRCEAAPDCGRCPAEAMPQRGCLI